MPGGIGIPGGGKEPGAPQAPAEPMPKTVCGPLRSLDPLAASSLSAGVPWRSPRLSFL